MSTTYTTPPMGLRDRVDVVLKCSECSNTITVHLPLFLYTRVIDVILREIGKNGWVVADTDDDLICKNCK